MMTGSLPRNTSLPPPAPSGTTNFCPDSAVLGMVGDHEEVQRALRSSRERMRILLRQRILVRSR